ncbi:hypothetical protein GCM10009839_14920 [Catenulispora yoronensis]|uniref:Flagellin Flp1-like domain-containing protein n=1 Tax=Catenulispora yoronensis TaxID=450799 RepID=A0ABN2TTA6_9ACTN
MIEQQLVFMKIQFDALRVMVGKLRRGEEGVTTLEVVIIGGFLLAAAGALTVLLNKVWTDDKGNISDKSGVVVSG